MPTNQGQDFLAGLLNKLKGPNAGPGYAGMLQPGNIDLDKRPIARRADGSYSTVYSMSFSDDKGREILVPRISEDGKVLSEKQAIAQYYATGKHLGVFADADSATNYAKVLHQQQASQYAIQAAKDHVMQKAAPNDK